MSDRPIEWCREELGAEAQYRKCNQPAEFILWGKLLKPEALGPRCYDCAAKHVHHSALSPNSGWAIFDLRTVERRECLGSRAKVEQPR